MRIAMFSCKTYDRDVFQLQNLNFEHSIEFFDAHLNINTVFMAKGFDVVCVFVNDVLSRQVIEQLKELDVKIIALRCSGFNNVDLRAVRDCNLSLLNVPDYSPNAVAEHSLALIQTLNRKTHKAYNRIREGNFSLQGLMGFDLHLKTVGIIGTGRIGSIFANIMLGIGCKVIAYDPVKNPECERYGLDYVSLDYLMQNAEIISLHCPLNSETSHLINASNINKMPTGVMLINTSRGGLVDTKALIKGLKTGKIGYVGLDVYEEEGDLFFEDYSDYIIQDEVFARLMTFPNVLITGHQGFFTDTALNNIANTTLQNITQYEAQGSCHGLKGCLINNKAV